MEIRVEKTATPKEVPAEVKSFGKIFTDHMFVMDYREGEGWHDARIVPYGNVPIDPAACVLHYGQGIFEGLKAYKGADGVIRLFRPRANFERMNRSAQKVCMPELDIDFVLGALEKLVRLEAKWVPDAPGTSLYIRPFMVATEAYLGVHAAKEYQFFIILSPSGPYFANGLEPVDIIVEDYYVRAVRGGLGEAKTLANYAASLLAGEEAQAKGYEQVLWLDGVERKYIEEIGAMNIMFKIDGKVVTPPLTGTILPGITRDSVIKVLKNMGVPVEEYRISIDELIDYHKNGKLEEMFGTGTAAVISPVGKLVYKDQEMKVDAYDENSICHKLYDTITGIQTGRLPDPFDWVVTLD